MLNQRRRHLVRLERRKTCPCATHCSQSWEATKNPGHSCNPSTPSSSQLTRRSSRHRWTSQPSERSSMTACKHSITLIPPFQQFVSIRIVVSYSDPHLFAPGTSYGTSFVRTWTWCSATVRFSTRTTAQWANPDTTCGSSSINDGLNSSSNRIGMTVCLLVVNGMKKRRPTDKAAPIQPCDDRPRNFLCQTCRALL